MYNYSPIHKLYVKNFRNIGEVEIDFSESPIVTLVGENEAGKTSVIKAFATCALHANPREQKDCIRDGTKMFGVAIDLKDGTRIVRMKEATGLNSYQVLGTDGKLVWSTNKITDGLPIEVQNVMGLIAEPETGEFLHIRTYEDKLLFVVTPNSTNYKVMYNALKVEQLTKAIKLGSTEVNTLKSQINNNEISMQTLQGQLKSIQIVDVEPLVNVKNRLIEQIAYLDKLEHIIKLNRKVEECERQLGALALLDKFKLDYVNEVVANKLNTANRLLNRNIEINNLWKNISEVNSLAEIDCSVVNKLSNVINKQNLINDKIKDAGALVQLSEISEISELNVMQLNKLHTLIINNNNLKDKLSKIDLTGCTEIDDVTINSITKLQRVSTLYDSISSKSSELAQINTYIEQIHDYMKQCGVAVETCPKCGEAVIFDVDKIEQF